MADLRFLSPWLDCIDIDPSVTFQSSHSPARGVIVTLRTSFHDTTILSTGGYVSPFSEFPLFSTHQHTFPLAHLRQTLEIMRLLVALRCLHRLWTWNDSSAARALGHDTPIALRLELAVTSPDAAAALEPSLSDALLCPDVPTSEAFACVYTDLVGQLLEADGYDELDRIVVDIDWVVVVSTASTMAGAIRFLQQVNDTKARSGPVDGSRESIRLTKDPVRLVVHPEIILTRQLVVEADRLKGMQGYFHCDVLTLAPMALKCSADEYSSFLWAIATGATDGLEIQIAQEPIDDPSMWDPFLRGIGACELVRRIDFVGLKTENPHRSMLYQVLVHTLLTREPPIDIAFTDAHVSESDSTALLTYARRWRATHQESLLRVQTLSVRIVARGDSFMNAFVDVLDTVEAITFRNKRSQMHHRLVETMLTKFVHLRRLCLSNLSLPTMRVFLSPTGPRLETLALEDMELDSFAYFAEALGDASAALGNLRSLALTHSSAQESFFTVSSRDGQRLAASLERNQVLERVEIDLYGHSIRAMEQTKDLLERTAGRPVAPRRGSRMYLENQARQRAFLSVIGHTTRSSTVPYMGSVLVAPIFAFAAPRMEREVKIRMRPLEES